MKVYAHLNKLLTLTFLMSSSMSMHVNASDDEAEGSHRRHHSSHSEKKSKHKYREAVEEFSDVEEAAPKKHKKASQFESKLKQKISKNIPQIFKVRCDGDGTGHTGTAFMFNAELGILATNHHVAPPDFGLYKIEDQEGHKYSKEEVKVLGVSPSSQYGDFAFFQVEKLARKFTQMPMVSEHTVAMHDIVAFMGNSEGEFSVEIGNVNTLYEFSMSKLIESFPFQIYCRGGASGSATYNRDGEINGILYGGSETIAIAHPIWFVQRAFSIMMSGPVPQPISLKSFHCTFETMNAKDICDYHHIERHVIEPYLVDAAKTKQSLLYFIGNYRASKDAPQIQDGDVLLTINGHKIGCDTIKVTQILDANAGNVTIEVLRVGEIISLSILPHNAVQQYAKRFILDDVTVYSHTPSFFNEDYKENAPVLVDSGQTIYDLEKEGDDGFHGAVKKINQTAVATFEDFLKAFHQKYVVAGYEHLTLTIHNEKDDFSITDQVDLTTLSTVAPRVTYFDYAVRSWKKLELERYLRQNHLITTADA